jgi:hypothetical protein
MLMRMYNYFLRSPHKQGAGAWEAIPNNPGSEGFYGKHCFKELNDKAAYRRRRQMTIQVDRATTIGSSNIVQHRHANLPNLFKPLPTLLSYQRPIRAIHVFILLLLLLRVRGGDNARRRGLHKINLKFPPSSIKISLWVDKSAIFLRILIDPIIERKYKNENNRLLNFQPHPSSGSSYPIPIARPLKACPARRVREQACFHFSISTTMHR